MKNKGLVLLFLLMLPFSGAFALTAADLEVKCVSSGKGAQAEGQMEMLLNTGSCAGFVGGVVSGIDLIGTMLKQQGGIKERLFCLPEGLHGQQLVSQLVKYIRAHGELRSQPAQLVIFKYARETYPCN